jgi:uncharacterized membrane protein (DUF441 family)
MAETAMSLVWRGFPVWGVVLVTVGLWWLGGEAHWWSFDGAFVGPVALMAAGAGMIVAWTGRRR